MKKESEQFFQELKKDITNYGELKLELLKLGTYERTGKVISVLSYGLILLVLAFFLVFFIFFALGYFLSEWLHSTGIGFAIIAVLYALLIGCVALFKDKIKISILNAVIAAMTVNDNKTDATNRQSNTDTVDTTEQTAG